MWIFLGVVLFLSTIPLSILAGRALGNNIRFLQQVMPTEACPGNVVTATGYGLDATYLKDIYLTDGEVDYRIEILEQSKLAVQSEGTGENSCRPNEVRHRDRESAGRITIGFREWEVSLCARDL
jgi:hypothetical protein